MKIQNISDSTQMIPNIPAFQPQEVRDLPKEQAERLARNKNFSLVKSEKKVKKESNKDKYKKN